MADVLARAPHHEAENTRGGTRQAGRTPKGACSPPAPPPQSLRDQPRGARHYRQTQTRPIGPGASWSALGYGTRRFPTRTVWWLATHSPDHFTEESHSLPPTPLIFRPESPDTRARFYPNCLDKTVKNSRGETIRAAALRSRMTTLGRARGEPVPSLAVQHMHSGRPCNTGASGRPPPDAGRCTAGQRSRSVRPARPHEWG